MIEREKKNREKVVEEEKKIVFGCLHDVYSYACKVVLRVCIEVQLEAKMRKKNVYTTCVVGDRSSIFLLLLYFLCASF